MGRAIAEVASERDDVVVSDVIGRGDPLPAAPPAGSVLIDFSTAPAVVAAAKWCQEHRVPMVCGTTALDDAALRAIDLAAQSVAVMRASNMSVGVAVLCKLVSQAAAALGDEFDIEIVEAHHRAKIDAPSGTALSLVEAAKAGRGRGEMLCGRAGVTGARLDDHIGVSSVRGGSVVGDHTVMLLGPSERVELVHRADDRDIFARGAVRAALWVRDQPTGRYDMADVLGDVL